MDLKDLLSKFVSAIDAEIAFVEKRGGEQSYELLAGQRDERATGLLYVFVLADPLRLPEDAAGTLKLDGRDVPAMVVSVEANRIWLLVESQEDLPQLVSSARLVLNETDLLKRLREKIDTFRSEGRFGLGPKVFGFEPPSLGYSQDQASCLLRLDESGKAALRQCVGSDVAFVWGPPGTGKTFTIAALVSALAELEETVLVTSHTHAAVEQALWAVVEPPSDGRDGGFLYDSPLIEAGKVLKVGAIRSEKLPPYVHLDSYLEARAKDRDANIAILESERQRLLREAAELRSQLKPWEAFHAAQSRFDAAESRRVAADSACRVAAEAAEKARATVEAARVERARAEKSFFLFRSGRIANAERTLRTANAALARAQANVATADARALRTRAATEPSRLALGEAAQRVKDLAREESLEASLAEFEQRAGAITEEVEALQAAVDDDAKRLVQDATAIFATLTKLYTDRKLLPDLTWDTVIIDEVSMAVPPLVAYAASLARKRVVLVGDMYQLAPVVNSDRDQDDNILSTDVFELGGITEAVDRGEPSPALAKLTTQRRMHPSIALGAKALIEAYSELRDAPSVENRTRPDFIDALGVDGALVTLDISDLNPWSGKMPGTLSRFNILSAHAAVEVSLIFANQTPEPDSGSPPPIGIVTPYAAQRRYLSRLIQVLGLQRWVTAGTVHTFQGSECDVIIFDSVLGEPHWTSRFTNPSDWHQVRRDLNVAITRARHQFVFVGDARWLRKHAGAGTGFGRLWGFLQDRAVHLTVDEVLGSGFRERVAKSRLSASGWDLDAAPRAALLTEADFYPSFLADLAAASERVILYTPFIGKSRWPLVANDVAAAAGRGVEVFLLHKPLTDREWRQGDPEFGKRVFDSLEKAGVHLIPISGIHAKTIVVDSEVVYEGSLNWASQVASHEHMWRFKSKDMAMLVERMLQLRPVQESYATAAEGGTCPKCGGPLVLVNQAQLGRQGNNDVQPLKLGCLHYFEDKHACSGYLRRVDGRAPFARPPRCERGAVMRLNYSRNGRPWDWRCGHSSCRPVRWVQGDCVG